MYLQSYGCCTTARIYLARPQYIIPLPPLYIIILYCIHIYMCAAIIIIAADSSGNVSCRSSTIVGNVRDPLDQLQLVIVFKLCAAEKKMYITRVPIYYITYRVIHRKQSDPTPPFYSNNILCFIFIFRIFNYLIKRRYRSTKK